MSTLISNFAAPNATRRPTIAACLEPVLVLWLIALAFADPCRASLVGYRIETVSLEGTAIESVAVGDEFGLSVWVQDIRSAPLGLVSAYLDVLYEPDLVSVLPDSFVFGPHFGDITRGDLTRPGVLDEVGSFARGYTEVPPLPDALAEEEHLLFEVYFRARSPGLAHFAASGADNLPRHATTLIGLDTAVPDKEMEFGTATLVIVPEPSSGISFLAAAVSVWLAIGIRRIRHVSVSINRTTD